VLRHYYFNIHKALAGLTSLEDAIVAVDEQKTLRVNFGRDIVLDLTSQAREFETFHFPCNQILNSNNWEYGLMAYNQQLMSRFMDFRMKVLEPFREYMIPVIALKKQTSKEAVCLVFEKVNTGGVPLSVFELVTATYAADGFNLRDDWQGPPGGKGRHHQLAAKPLLKDLEPTDFLQAISLLHTYERRQADIAAKKGSKDITAVSAKREHILVMPLAAYQKWADRLTKGFLEADAFLRGEGFRHTRFRPYRTQVVPLAAVMTHLAER